MSRDPPFAENGKSSCQSGSPPVDLGLWW